MLFFYNLLFPFVFILYLPRFIIKLFRRGGVTFLYGERFSLFSREQRQALRAHDRPVWIHAVSVGEVVAACGFIRRWQARSPNQTFVLSTTTTTGHETAGRKLPGKTTLIYCPLDWYPFVRRTLRLIRPARLVIFEVEIWPNLVSLTVRKGVPVALVNGRLSERSAAGYARHRWLFQPLFERFSVFCMQSEADAEHVRRIVGDRVPVHVCHTMKFDQVADVSESEMPREQLDAAFGPGERLVWTAGSTHDGEETLVADVFLTLKEEFPALKLVLAPRHHERTGEVERTLREKQLRYRLLAPHGSPDATSTDPVDVLLVNTTGELMAFYAAADLVFVGKSLAGQHGGHNIIEPAIFAKPIVHGTNMENFELVVDAFRDRDGSREVSTADELTAEMRRLCASETARIELGNRARQVVETCRGAMDITLDHLQVDNAIETT